MLLMLASNSRASLAFGIYIPHAQLEEFFFKDRQKMSVFFASYHEQVNFNFKVFTSLILSKILAMSSQCSVTGKLVWHSDYTDQILRFLYRIHLSAGEISHDPRCIK